MPIQRISCSVSGNAALPIGRPVELRVLVQDTAVFGTKLEPNWEQPFLVDLETGVLYAQRWHYANDFRDIEGILSGRVAHAPVHMQAQGIVVRAMLISADAGMQRSEDFTLLSIDVELAPGVTWG